MIMHKCMLKTSEGYFAATFTENGLAALDFPSARSKPVQMCQVLPALPEKMRHWMEWTAAALNACLEGRNPRKIPPLDLSVGTDFQRQVWRALAKIPCGETRTYGQIARTVGRPEAVRAVGSACGRNPLPVFIPCHRVLPKGGGLGGFSAGLRWKKQLLAAEKRAA